MLATSLWYQKWLLVFINYFFFFWRFQKLMMVMQHASSVMWHLLSRHWPNSVHLITHWLSICVTHYHLSNYEHTVLLAWQLRSVNQSQGGGDWYDKGRPTRQIGRATIGTLVSATQNNGTRSPIIFTQNHSLWDDAIESSRPLRPTMHTALMP